MRAILVSALAALGLAVITYAVLRYVGDVSDKMALTGSVVVGMIVGWTGV